jgi:hypothetical protein
MRMILLAAGVLTSLDSLAVSRLNDYEASAVIKDNKPCFYINRPVEAITPGHLRGRGVTAEVHALMEKRYSTKWAMWLRQRMKDDPVSPTSCIPYGTVSPNSNRQKALELDLDTPYYFFLSGEYGTYALYFCLRRATDGSVFLVKSERPDNWKCTEQRIERS